MEIGQRIGSYEVRALLGEGATGTVYLAEHTVIGRKAAIKVLKSDLVVSKSHVRRFTNEARATNAIKHPSIVDVIDVGALPDGAPYLIMEYLQGESLARRLATGGRLHPAEAVEFARQTASAAAAAHAMGIIHRDLKPENLFLIADPVLEGRERVKVLDFGIAKLRGALTSNTVDTRTGYLLGTPKYMSPEQRRGIQEEIDHRSDIYAIGIILYEMVCGAPPFVSAGFGEILMMQMAQPPVPPSKLNPEVPAAIEAAILRALAKRPEDRFPDAQALEEALRVGMPESSDTRRPSSDLRPSDEFRPTGDFRAMGELPPQGDTRPSGPGGGRADFRLPTPGERPVTPVMGGRSSAANALAGSTGRDTAPATAPRRTVPGDSWTTGALALELTSARTASSRRHVVVGVTAGLLAVGLTTFALVRKRGGKPSAAEVVPESPSSRPVVEVEAASEARRPVGANGPQITPLPRRQNETAKPAATDEAALGGAEKPPRSPEPIDTGPRPTPGRTAATAATAAPTPTASPTTAPPRPTPAARPTTPPASAAAPAPAARPADKTPRPRAPADKTSRTNRPSAAEPASTARPRPEAGKLRVDQW